MLSSEFDVKNQVSQISLSNGASTRACSSCGIDATIAVVACVFQCSPQRVREVRCEDDCRFHSGVFHSLVITYLLRAVTIGW